MRIQESNGSYYIELSHDVSWLIEAGLEKSRVADCSYGEQTAYKIEDCGVSLTPGTFNKFKVLKKVS